MKYIMGCHIEMSQTLGEGYPATSRYQPDELPLEMTVDQLKTVEEAAIRVESKPGPHVFDNFAIYNGPCYSAMIKQLFKAYFSNLKRRTAV
ncbi:MAG: hypothetical protein ACYCSO_00105 [Cuniculiplasma sp.]